MRSKWASMLLVLLYTSVTRSQPILTDVPYGNAPGQKLDVYLSSKPSSPLVILIHGGAWFGGSKGEMSELALFLRDKGYAVSSIDYSVSWQATFPANIQDVACAIAYLKKNASAFRADSSRVALLGYSAGGHLAMLHATAANIYQLCEPGSDATIDAMIGVCGIYSFKHRVAADPDRLLQMLGDSARYWNEADPIQHLSGVRETKFLLLTDAVDYIVPPVNTYDLYDSLRSHKIDAQLQVFHTKDHFNVLSTITDDDSVMSAIARFLSDRWPSASVALDTVHYDVDIDFQGRRIELYSRYAGRIILYNILGQVVTMLEVDQGVSEHYLWNVPYGCYFVSVLTNNRRTTARVILD